MIGGDDIINGGPGDDILTGDGSVGEDGAIGGDDKINGGTGDDRLRGGFVDEVGDPGDNRLQGGPGTDLCTEGPTIKQCEP